MSEIDFPIKDLTRKKQQTTLTIVGLTIATFTTVFLVLFGSNLGVEISSIAEGGKLSSGFQNIFSQFILIVSGLNIITGPVVASFLVHLMLSTRMRDIGVMKASGCLGKTVFAYFFTEISLIVLVSTAAGLILGIASYYLSTFFLSLAGFSVSENLDIVLVLVIAFISIVCSHISGALPIRKASQAKPIDALSPIYQQETFASVGSKVPSKLGFTLKVVYRNLVRRQSATIHAIICFTAVLTLTTVIITGGLVAKDTTSRYTERAIGKNVILIGHSTVTERYVDLLSQFFEPKTLEVIDYLDPKLAISEQFLDNLETINGITTIDARLVLETLVRESLGVVLDPIEQSEAILIGSNRTETAIVLGVHPENVVNDWLFFGKKVGVNEQNVAMIGDSLAAEMFEDAMNQRIRVFEGSELPYDITGSCVDPLNNGKVVYLPIETMYKGTGKNGYNLIFVQIDPSDKQVYNKIAQIALAEKLDIVELDLVLDKHMNFLNSIWSLVMFLPLFTLATAAVALFSYISLSISGQQHEFGIMRAMGAKKTTIIKLIFCQATIIILVSGLIGIFTGVFITFAFLLPDSIICSSTINLVFVLLLTILGLLCFFSLYPALKTAKKKVIDSLYLP